MHYPMAEVKKPNEQETINKLNQLLKMPGFVVVEDNDKILDEKIELISDAIYDLKREVKRLAIKIDNCNQNSSQTAKVGKAEVSLKSSSIMDGKKKNKEADTPDVTTSKESTDK